MTLDAPARDTGRRDRFHHEAFFYAGAGEFVEGAARFVADGLAADEPVFVVVAADKIRMLRVALGGDAERVRFADMAQVGANPARIIPAWEEFVRDHAGGGRPLRGIGEPVGPDRNTVELLECHRHEALLNVAFVDAPVPFELLCPYDLQALDPEVVAEARRTHPYVVEGAVRCPSPAFRPLDPVSPFDDPLPEPPDVPVELPFGGASLHQVRDLVREVAGRAGFDAERIDDLVLAVNEVATNSLRHGGGAGTMRLWEDDWSFVCEISDRGHIDQPLVGRQVPPLDGQNGRGVWLANQLCDLVQLSSSPVGTVMRLHLRRA